MSFQAGYDKGATFQLDGAGSAITLYVTGWNLDDGVDALEVTHTGTAGLDAYIAGIGRIPGTVRANVDAAALPNGTSPGIKAGAKGTLKNEVGSTTPWITHIMITNVPWKSEVAGLLQYEFSYKSDSYSDNAIAAGFYPRTRPA